MTVSTTTSRVEYAGNGSTTAFSVPFYFLANGDLKVYKAGVLQTLTTHYTVSGAGNPAGGTVTFLSAPETGQSVVVFRDPALTQNTDYVPNDPFPAESHERALDRLTMIAQRNRDLVGRAFVLPDGDTSGASTTLPSPEANEVIAWNSSGTALENRSASDFATALTYSNWRTDLFSGTGSATDFTLTASPAVVHNMDVSIGGVTQVPGVDYNLSGDATKIVFTSAPPSGTSNICVRYGSAAAQGRDDAATVFYSPSGVGSISRSVQDKLREIISSSDYPTVQAAVNALSAGDTLIIQPGSYTEYDIDIATSEIIIENYGDFTLPANARESIFKIAEGVSDVTFRNYGVLDGNRFNQGDCNTIPLGTGILEVSNDLASQLTYRIRVENYGTFKDGANNGIYVHRKVYDFTLDPAGYFVGHRNDGVASSSTNYRFKIANGFFSQCGSNGQAIAACADYSIIDRITVKNPAVGDDGVTLGGNIGITLGHSGTPPETSHYSQITNCQIIDIGDSSSGILLKAGLSDKSIIANNTIVRTTGETSGGAGIRLIGGAANTNGMTIANNTIVGPWGYGIMNWDYTATGYTISQVVVENNYINITSNSAETLFFTAGTKHTFVGNHVENNGTTCTGIRLDSSDCVISSNRFIATSVGVKINSCANLICTSNAITAGSIANCIVLDQIQNGQVIGLNNKNGQIQSGVPIVTGRNTAAATNPALGAVDSGGVTSYLVTLNNEVSGKTSSTYQSGIYFVTNITDNTHAIFAYTGFALSGGFTILASSGANWSTTYNAATKEGIALNASGDGPILFSNRSASKTYRVVCFGGS